MLCQETTLSLLSGSSETQRLAVCMVHCQKSGETKLRLREESFSADVGWYVQGYVDLSPEQIGELRGVLGNHGSRKPRVQAPPSSRLELNEDFGHPHVLQMPINRAG